jgi:tripartite-type tricarboxylate transporter receptor subunit TctC
LKNIAFDPRKDHVPASVALRIDAPEEHDMPRAPATLAVVLAAFAVCASVGPARAVDFSGKTITMVLSFAPGGGYDTYGRLFASRLSQHLPGRPAVIVKNMPGAGGLLGANYLFNLAPRDGTTIGVVPQTVVIAQVLGGATVKFDAQKFNWIGRIDSNVEVEQTWYTSGIKTIADAKSAPVVVAGTGPDSSSVVFPHLLNDTLGTKFKVVSGYSGVSMAALAMERGEVQGMVRPWSVTKIMRPEWLRNKKINLIVQYAGKRHPELSDVPAVVDLAQNDSQREIFALYASGSDIGRSIVAPPDLTPDIVKVLRSAFNETIKDPAFLAGIKANALDFDPLDGTELQTTVRRAAAVPPDVVGAARKYYAEAQ